MNYEEKLSAETITFEKFFFNLKKCWREFIVIGVAFWLFVYIVFFRERSSSYDVDKLINAYETETGQKVWDYRRNLIKREISKKKPDKSGAEKIIFSIASQAPKK